MESSLEKSHYRCIEYRKLLYVENGRVIECSYSHIKTHQRQFEFLYIHEKIRHGVDGMKSSSFLKASPL